MILEEKDYLKLLSNKERKKNVLWSFYSLSALLIIDIFIGLFYYFQLIKFNNNEIEDISTLETIYAIFNILVMINMIATIVFFILWFRRSYANLNRIGVYIENKENMALWGFIIPILNWFKPVKIAKEIDLKYDYLVEELDSNHQKNYNNYSVIVAWWVLFWVENVYSRITFKTDYESLDQMIDYQLYDIIGFGITLLSAILTILLIQSLGKTQDKLEDLAELEELKKIGADTVS
ncbi:DUF4328 domain-containing protein [Faecalibacter macacae]|uniref:DUF4328 domain-containing protein n=1 Tax=Faecalibacter macacae TaxID=1859289 RepID=A0A3L9M8K4_9FLAO|nr:DUF4328 domain-containing protein [Faecalibacter macacae]RLZ09122.1 DUF4328 domain-containing protein [Faecalibacter macacae]